MRAKRLTLLRDNTTGTQLGVLVGLLAGVDLFQLARDAGTLVDLRQEGTGTGRS
jgi:hypothetical protein